jgi:uncharacterized protein YgiM (DUF1202 family)
MKKNLWITLITLISGSLLAQPVTNTPPAPSISTPAPAPAVTETNAAAPVIAATNSIASPTNAPAKKSGKKKAAVKKSADKKTTNVKKSSTPPIKTVPLVAGPASVIASNVNVRGQAKLNSEVITKVTKGQSVTVLEEVDLKKSGPDEPSAWAKIILPETAHVWVNAPFIDATNKTVLPKRLKLRGGPSENYSVLGFLKQGDPVKEVSTKGDWIEIEAPAEASAFVAAQYLRQDAAGTNPTEVATAATVTEPPAVAPATEPTLPPPAEGTAPTNTVASTETTTNEPAPVVEEPPPPRIVQREGFVRGTFSIQAPTRFELISMDTHRPINYLLAESKDLDLSRYKGLHIIVTGEEGLDERWRNAPVLTIQKIQVLE